MDYKSPRPKMSRMYNDETILKKFGENLQRLRLSKDITQEALAELADFDRTYISLLERGKRNPSLISICRIAAALGVEPTIFLDNILESK